MNQQRSNKLFIYLIILWLPNIIAETPVRKSCLDHFLSGESATQILPIFSLDNSKHYFVECIFPFEKESDRFVGTQVHSALEKWHRIEPGKRETIGYQISDRNTLKHLVESSEECSQEFWVQWPTLASLPEGQILGFTVQSIEGTERVFQRNLTLEGYTEALTLQTYASGNSHGAALLHILGTDAKHGSENVTAQIKLGPLRCEERIVENVDCLFEINEKPDWIKVSGISQGKVKFAFRTDQPEGPFLRVTADNGSFIQMDLLDGYLLTVGHVIHPVKLLADGNWHTATFDVKTLTLQIDDSSPIIYLSAMQNAATSEKAVTEVQILLNGQITAIRGGPSEEWLCSDSSSVKSELTEQILRRICPPYEANYCRCQAPPSVLEKPNCGKVNAAKAFQLDRSSTKLAFFYLSSFAEKSKVSVVFRSDSEMGLIFFGIANTGKSSTRVQAHFAGDRFFAASCTRSFGDGSERCRSCSVTRTSEDSKNEWIRVSYFHYKNYSFLSVDGAICQLLLVQTASAEAHLLDGANLYQPKTISKSALFVGGTYSSKKSPLTQHINSTFRQDFLEMTNEKAPSLKGCIAEIIVNEVRADLEKLYAAQINVIAKNENSKQHIFSMGKCQSCRVPVSECAGAKCRSPSPLSASPPVCDCSSIFALQEESSGRCLVDDPSFSRKFGGLKLTASKPLLLNRTKFAKSRRAMLDRIWMLLRLPESHDDVKVIFRLGGIQIKVADRGKRVIVDIDDSSHEFTLQSSDERLHLIAIKRNPTLTQFSEPGLQIQVDNVIRHVEIEGIPIDANHEIEIIPIVETEENKDAFPGCLAAVDSEILKIAFLNGKLLGTLLYEAILELSVGYEYRESSRNQSDKNRAHTADLLQPIISDIIAKSSPLEISLIQRHPCGIRDPFVWTSNSSDYGIIGDYDPYGDGGDSSAGISLFVTILIVLIILLTLILYCYCRQKKSKQYQLNTQRYKPTIGKEEKVPLKDTYLDTSRSSTDHSHVDLSATSPPLPTKSNGDAPLQANRVIVKEVKPEPPLQLTNLPGSPKRFNRPVVQRIAPDGSPVPPSRASPRIIPPSSGIRPIPIVIASQRAPIAKVDDL